MHHLANYASSSYKIRIFLFSSWSRSTRSCRITCRRFSSREPRSKWRTWTNWTSRPCWARRSPWQPSRQRRRDQTEPHTLPTTSFPKPCSPSRYR